MENSDFSFVFFGTPELVTTILDELSKEGLKPLLIITSPDKPKGRKMLLAPPPAKIWAQINNIPFLQPEKIDVEFIENLKKYNFDIGIVVAYGKILPENLLNLPKFGMFNVHYSLLPKYRGATPVESAILNGEKETGVVIQKMVFKLDEGPIVAEEKISIDEKETALRLRERLNNIGKKLLTNLIKEVLEKKVIYQEQNHLEATYTKKIKKEDGQLDLGDNPQINYRKFKAYYGSIGTSFFVKKNSKEIRLKIIDAEFTHGEFRVLRIIPEGGREMNYEDFLRG